MHIVVMHNANLDENSDSLQTQFILQGIIKNWKGHKYLENSGNCDVILLFLSLSSPCK